MSPIEELPPELIDKICDCLAGDPRSSKDLRLVSPRFSRSVQHIFHTLILYQHHAHWRKLGRIAKVPALARWVRVIKLVHVHSLPRCDSFKDFSQQKRAGRWVGNDVVLKDAYEAYQYWDTGFQVVRKWSHKLRVYASRSDLAKWRIPPMHLENLVDLQKIETVGHAGLAKLNQGRSHLESRQEQETTLDHSLTRRQPDGNHHLELFLFALQRAGNQFSQLHLRGVYEIIPGPTPLLRFELGSFIQKLDIDLTGQKRLTPHRLHEQLSPSLRTMEALESLSLRQSPLVCYQQFAGRNYDVFGVLAEASFSKLRSLSLIHVLTPEETLRRFLQENRATLVSLTVRNPLIRRISWNGLRRAIYDGSDGDVFLPKEGKELCLTDSYFESLAVPRAF